MFSSALLHRVLLILGYFCQVISICDSIRLQPGSGVSTKIFEIPLWLLSNINEQNVTDNVCISMILAGNSRIGLCKRSLCSLLHVNTFIMMAQDQPTQNTQAFL